jgi:thiamine pyrophosphate-dependent acetolactate synthase large subunit-like protein
MTVGAALAARDSGRTVVGMLGDGDLLMAPSALWTAAHHQLPMLVVVANNQSYFNDEEHQERMARVRRRPVENRWVGQRMADPPVNFAGLARDLGVDGFGPIEDPAELANAYRRAVAAVAEGRPALVDVRITPR